MASLVALAGALAWLAVPGGRAGSARADEEEGKAEPGEEAAEAEDRTDEQCVECHSDKKLLEKQETRKHYIDPEIFAQTSHGEAGCSSCHAAVTTAHPKDEKKVEKAECDTCHEETATEYAASKHADQDQAVCTDCHNPHDVKKPDVVTSVQMNAMCEKCHERPDLALKHEGWLPQMDYHLAALPCIACHTGSTDYVIALYVERRTAGPVGEPMKRAELAKLVPAGKSVSSLVDANGDDRITLDELRRFNRRATKDGIRLQAMMVPEKVTHSYQILRNRYDCTFCHAKGPDKKQKAFVAFPEEGDRRFTRIAVQEGAILDILAGTPDFYMIGASATRNSWMNLFGLGFVGMGMCFVGSHSFFRLLTTRRRRKGHAQRKG